MAFDFLTLKEHMKFEQFISNNYFPHHCHIEVTMASVIVALAINNINNFDQHTLPQGGEGCSQAVAADRQSVCQRHPVGSG